MTGGSLSHCRLPLSFISSLVSSSLFSFAFRLISLSASLAVGGCQVHDDTGIPNSMFLHDDRKKKGHAATTADAVVLLEGMSVE